MNNARVVGVTFTLVLVLAFGACGGSSSSPTTPAPTTPAPTGPVATLHGTMSATINGVAWSATTVTPVNPGADLVVIGVDGALQGVAFYVSQAAPGTFPMNGFTNAAVSITQVNFTTQQWSSIAPGTGAIVISTLTPTGASGTFSFTAFAVSGGATGTKVVTNGVFNVTF